MVHILKPKFIYWPPFVFMKCNNKKLLQVFHRWEFSWCKDYMHVWSHWFKNKTQISKVKFTIAKMERHFKIFHSKSGYYYCDKCKWWHASYVHKFYFISKWKLMVNFNMNNVNCICNNQVKSMQSKQNIHNTCLNLVLCSFHTYIYYVTIN